MKIREILNLTFATILLLVFASCGGGKNEESTSGSEEFEQAESELKSQVQEVAIDIPSPSEIPGILMRTGVEYNQDLLNNLEKLDSYTVNNNKAALNLGIYATDIGYLISYEKVQPALNYMSSSRTLADQLGLAGNFEQALVNRFESNLSNPDSLTIILDNTINNSSDFLKEDNRAKLAALLLTGSLVEGLYISTQLIESFPKDLLSEDQRNALLSDLIRIILDQERSTADVLKLLNTLEKTDDVKDLVSDFEKIDKSYKELNIAEKLESNQGNLVINDQTLVNIIKTVSNLRAKIVE